MKRTNANLAERDLPSLPDKITPHSLRRTFASVLYAVGEPPPVVMAEMGHTSPRLALRVDAQAMRLGDDEKARLGELVEGGFGQSMDTSAVETAIKPASGRAA